MQRFQYQYGDRPLEGYTIQRGVGRGGFGEVYYAISDSGKQVALKTLQTYEQIELRGINQCMNLKSPYLVTIFDVKYNDEGKPFVIMEYVSGPSLADIIRETPGGLGPQKTAFFLREISKGLSYLHGCGIVHRDLKPGNIFYEDGRVKIGDYGLSKSMNTSVHSGQTITVGTVHYMAPEIGAGCYNRSIDIYAMGVVVYEMLTGQVPFFGNSPAEVLMKHMSSQPDLTGIDETFARMIRKAMAKDPAERYSTVQEMVEDVFGSEHIRNSVSQFRPESLSIIAENLAKKISPQPGQAPIPGETPGSAPKPASGASGPRPASTVQSTGAAPRPEMVNDPLNLKQRTILAVLAAVMVSIGTGMLSGHRFMMMPHTAMMIGMILVGAKLILIARWKWLENLEDESGWLRHLLIAAIAAVPITMFINMINEKGGTWLAIAIGFAITDWWKLTSSNREQRVSLGQAFGAGLVGFIAAAIFNGQEAMAAGVVAGTCLVVQIWSAFSMTNSARIKFEQVQNIQDPLKRAAAMAAQAVNP
ncbi:MAG: serine/threonine protein kinase, partial [Phycisphaerae bacterium]|nr:serine/threonine protein kinase [Phycisphaerae bacterium]